MAPLGQRRLALTKHEGAGNDFLVVLDPTGAVAPGLVQPRLVRALCDRHLGVGADGLIVVGSGVDGTDLSMELRNADGSAAEMSGNGIRCLAQAAVEAGLVGPGRFTVATAAGIRTIEFRPGPDGRSDWASVDMGPVTLGDELSTPPVPGRRARTAEVGNPHLVVLCDRVDILDVTVLGPAIEAGYAGGINVEFIALGPPGPGDATDALELIVWERGAGRTLACGTGSLAAAAVARAWGMVGDTVAVHNPGGTLVVGLGAGPDGPTSLGGPVRKVADVVVDLATIP